MWYFQNAKDLSDVFTYVHLIAYFAISVANALLLLLISLKFLQIMQQSGYEGFGYFKWLRRRDNVYLTRLATLSMLSLLAFLIFNIIFAFADGAWVFYIGFVFYVMFSLNYYRADKKRKKKIPLIRTARMNRLITVYFFLLLSLTFGSLILLNVIAFYARANTLLVRIRFAPICIMPFGVPIFLLLAYYITKPFERSIQKKYIKKCTQKLKDRADLIKIGITGSYGKTSVKMFLRTILEEKYNVLATQGSYNTPMGICKSVKRLKSEHQIFIAEMGARHVGDISELAKIVEPNYAIINGITGQHLETFGTLSAIKQTKYELVENMKEGVVAYTVDSENTVSLFEDCKLKCIPAGLNKELASVYATDIKTGESGTDFELHIYEKSIRCHTSLIGTHNVSNICLAVAIANELGLTLPEISAGISRLTAVEHRLSVSKTPTGVTIIDDSYNSNSRGFEVALETLSYFNGRKIVITPGMVELGAVEDMENYLLGKKLAKACDIAILVGRSAIFTIKSGLVENGFNPDKIIQASTLEQAMKKLQDVIKEGDVILFENDLPDKFS